MHIFFSSFTNSFLVIEYQISDTAKKSEFKKVKFCTCSINFCKKLAKRKEMLFKSNFDKFYKRWCYGYINKLFWVLIFLLCHKFDILTSSQKFCSCCKDWAHNNISKLGSKLELIWWMLNWQTLQKSMLQGQKWTFSMPDFFTK